MPTYRRRNELSFASGVNLGDVMIEGRDLYGDGVNIAARLEALGSKMVAGKADHD